MAFFGAQVAVSASGRAAVRAALAALETSARIGDELEARGLPRVETRIGIHAGPAVVGNMGSAERFDYTAIGDAVNLASRLEGANKAFGTRCLVSESAWAMVGDEVLGREVGSVVVAGRAAPVRVFEPLALRAGATAAEVALAERWRAAVEALRCGARGETRAALDACAVLRPGDALAQLWLARLDDPAFDGAFRLDGK
jgi:adenylate cyclase